MGFYSLMLLLLLPLSAQAPTGAQSVADIPDATDPAVAAPLAPSSHGPYPYRNNILTASTTGSPTTSLTGAPKQSATMDCTSDPSCDAGIEVGMCLQAIPPSECDLLCEKFAPTAVFCGNSDWHNGGIMNDPSTDGTDTTSVRKSFRTEITPGSLGGNNNGATRPCANPGTAVGQVCSQGPHMAGGGVKNCDAFVDGLLNPAYKEDALRSQYKLVGFCEGGQLWDDPHVMTLSGNQFFMHGVGVFDYASIPGVIKTQAHMLPQKASCLAQNPLLPSTPHPPIHLTAGVHVSVCAVHLRDDGVG